VTVITPISEILAVAISGLGLATITLQTKVEVSNYTHYQDMNDMKSDANCRNWG